MIFRLNKGSGDKDKKKKRKKMYLMVEEEIQEGPNLPTDQNPSPQAVSAYQEIHDMPRSS